MGHSFNGVGPQFTAVINERDIRRIRDEGVVEAVGVRAERARRCDADYPGDAIMPQTIRHVKSMVKLHQECAEDYAVRVAETADDRDSAGAMRCLSYEKLVCVAKM